MDSTTETQASIEQKVVTDQQAAGEKQEVEEEYKDLGEYVAQIEPAIVEKKVIPTASYGHRIRI